MPTLMFPIRDSNSYIGVGKQASGGTAVAPSSFFWWMDGSKLEFDSKVEAIKESDTSRRESQYIKNLQMCKIHVTTPVRPPMLGTVECAAMGSGSDAITAGTPSGTLSAGVTGGTSTSCAVSGPGFSVFLSPASGTLSLLLSAGTAAQEIVPVTLPATGTNPYTFTVAATYNSGKFKNSHASSDTVAVLTTANTSLTSAATKGAATIAVGNTSNLTGVGTQVLVLSPGTASEEIVTVSTPASSGSGPWTFTLANSATLQKAHSSGDVVYSPVTHALTDQNDGDYYTLEVGLGSLYGGAGMTLRVRDCKLDQVKRSSKSGQLLMYDLDFTGTVTVSQGSPATVVMDTVHNPFLFTQGVWTIDSNAAGDALAIESFDITQKNNLDVVQTEALTPAAIIFGAIGLDLMYDCVYTRNDKTFQVYFGSATGTTDAQLLFTGSLLLVFTQADGFHTLTYSIPTVAYTKVTQPVPKADGKHYTTQVTGAATSNQGANTYLLQTSIANTQASYY